MEAVGLAGVESLSARRLRSRLRTRPGQPFRAAVLDLDRDGVLTEYEGEGFLGASVTPVTQFSAPDRVRFVVVDPVATLEDVGTHTTSSTALNLSYEGRDDVLDPIAASSSA